MSAATVEPATTTVERRRCMEAAACNRGAMVASRGTARYVAMSAVPRPTPGRMSIPRATVPSVSRTPPPKPYRTVEPWARPDEEAAREPIGSVVAIWGTGVRIVSVVAIRTGWSRPNRYADRTDSNSHADLGLRVCKWNHQDRQQRNISHVPHNHLQPRPALSGSGNCLRLMAFCGCLLGFCHWPLSLLI